MQINSDFEEILLAFNDAQVKYLVVGAYAVAAHSRPRATGDIDLWVEASAENARRVFRALAAFGAPMEKVNENTFLEPDIVFQIGVPPIRIDILTSIEGVSFDRAWPNRVASTVGRVTTNVIGRLDLLHNKKVSGRAKELADIERPRVTRSGRKRVSSEWCVGGTLATSREGILDPHAGDHSAGIEVL